MINNPYNTNDNDTGTPIPKGAESYIRAMLNRDNDSNQNVFVFDDEKKTATLEIPMKGVKKSEVLVEYYHPQLSGYDRSEIAFKIEYPNQPVDQFGVGFEYNNIAGLIGEPVVTLKKGMFKIVIQFETQPRVRTKLTIK